MQKTMRGEEGSPKFCWICGKGVALEKCKTDEHGSIVHEACYAARMKLKNFHSWRQQFREDCELHEKLRAFDAMGDTVLRLLFDSGLEPTVKAVVIGVREDKAS